MPLKRTPPTTPIFNANTSQSLCQSEPNLNTTDNTELEITYVAQRNKRRREEVDENSDMLTFKNEILSMFMDLKFTMKEIKEQNIRLQESVDFTSKKYDEITDKMQKMEENIKENKNYIRLLEAKIDQLERQTRYSSLEIRNVPKNNVETKKDLINLILKTGTVIKTPIQPSDIKDVFRTNSKTTNKPVIVEFTSNIVKESLLKSVKTFNKENKHNKLSTEHLEIGGPKTPIYISENLSTKTRRLFYLAREFATQEKIKFCWTTYGRIFLRREEGSPTIRIESESDFLKLKTQI